FWSNRKLKIPDAFGPTGFAITATRHCEERSDAAISIGREGGTVMIGWRARLGFLLPPGNPTVEVEMMALAPVGVSLHFHRMAVGGGVPGALDNQDERTRAMIDSLDDSTRLLAMVKPDIIVVAHTATSYQLGRAREADLLARLSEASGIRVVTAFGSVVAA